MSKEGVITLVERKRRERFRAEWYGTMFNEEIVSVEHDLGNGSFISIIQPAEIHGFGVNRVVVFDKWISHSVPYRILFLQKAKDTLQIAYKDSLQALRKIHMHKNGSISWFAEWDCTDWGKSGLNTYQKWRLMGNNDTKRIDAVHDVTTYLCDVPFKSRNEFQVGLDSSGNCNDEKLPVSGRFPVRGTTHEFTLNFPALSSYFKLRPERADSWNQILCLPDFIDSDILRQRILTTQLPFETKQLLDKGV